MKRSVFVVMLFLYIAIHKLSGQSDSVNRTTLMGTIIDDSLGHPLPYVHIWNESTKRGGVSNEYGEFNIEVRNQDTLVFSTIAYSIGLIIVSRSSINQDLIIRLKSKMYEIEAAVVKGFRSYESFKQQFINLDLTDKKTEYLREYLNSLGTIAAIEADRERAVKNKLNGFGYTTAINGRISPQKAKEEEIKRLKKRTQIINEKFNRTLVGDITRFEDEELTNFIAYCNFSEDYLYTTDLYTLIEAISVKLRIYQAKADTIPSFN